MPPHAQVAAGGVEAAEAAQRPQVCQTLLFDRFRYWARPATLVGCPVPYPVPPHGWPAIRGECLLKMLHFISSPLYAAPGGQPAGVSRSAGGCSAGQGVLGFEESVDCIGAVTPHAHKHMLRHVPCCAVPCIYLHALQPFQRRLLGCLTTNRRRETRMRSGWAASCTAPPCWARCGRSAPKQTTCAPVGVSVHCLLLVAPVHALGSCLERAFVACRMRSFGPAGTERQRVFDSAAESLCKMTCTG